MDEPHDSSDHSLYKFESDLQEKAKNEDKIMASSRKVSKTVTSNDTYK